MISHNSNDRMTEAETVGTKTEFSNFECSTASFNDPVQQQAFNNFRLKNAPATLHALVLVVTVLMQLFVMAEAFRRGLTSEKITELVLRWVGVGTNVLYTILFVAFKVGIEHEWVDKFCLFSNRLSNLNLLLVLSVGCAQLLSVIKLAEAERDDAVYYIVGILYQTTVARKIFSIADIWAGPAMCVIAGTLCCITAYWHDFPVRIVLVCCVFFSVGTFSDVDNYVADFRRFIEYTNAVNKASHSETQKNVAEYASKEMRSFIGNIAHDLKTPLQSFVSELDLLSEMSAKDTIRSSVASLRGLCTFMLMTINRSLDFVKSESGVNLVPSNGVVSIKGSIDFVVNCIKRVSVTVPVLCTGVSACICDDIITDKQWLEENLLCFTSNACKFTTSGSVEIRVSQLSENELEKLQVSYDECSSDAATVESDIASECEDTSTQMLLFEVEDSGIGLTTKQIKALFRPFKQAQRKAGGTGLGLYALAKRVDAIGGRYGVRGRRDGGRGCLFWFAIPYRPDRTVSENATPWLTDRDEALTTMGQKLEAVPAVFEEVESKDISNLKILLVDDSPLIQKTTSKILLKAKHTVTTAIHGVHCLEILAERGDEFDVILMDMQMPVMDGIETIHRIRELEAVCSGDDDKRRRLFIIGLSANSDSETRATAMEAGADGFIAKPITIVSFNDMFGSHDVNSSPDSPYALMDKVP